MPVHTAIFLFLAGALGGALNAVAGGGSFIAFPALMFTGVAPIAANATNTVALWMGVTASTGAYRKRLDLSRRVMVPLAITSLIGGVAGAYLLLHTPAQTFLRVLPWLMLGATLLFVFGGDRAAPKKAWGATFPPTRSSSPASSTVRRGLWRLFWRRRWHVNLAMLAAIGMTISTP